MENQKTGESKENNNLVLIDEMLKKIGYIRNPDDNKRQISYMNVGNNSLPKTLLLSAFIPASKISEIDIIGMIFDKIGRTPESTKIINDAFHFDIPENKFSKESYDIQQKYSGLTSFLCNYNYLTPKEKRDLEIVMAYLINQETKIDINNSDYIKNESNVGLEFSSLISGSGQKIIIGFSGSRLKQINIDATNNVVNLIQGTDGTVFYKK